MFLFITVCQWEGSSEKTDRESICSPLMDFEDSQRMCVGGTFSRENDQKNRN